MFTTISTITLDRCVYVKYLFSTLNCLQDTFQLIKQFDFLSITDNAWEKIVQSCWNFVSKKAGGKRLKNHCYTQMFNAHSIDFEFLEFPAFLSCKLIGIQPVKTFINQCFRRKISCNQERHAKNLKNKNSSQLTRQKQFIII